MPKQTERVSYIDDIVVRRRDGGEPRPSRLTIRHTQVYRLRNVRSASIAHLEPDFDDLFLLGSITGPVDVGAGSETMAVRPAELGVVSGPEVTFSATEPADIVLAVSQGTVIREMGLGPGTGRAITRIPVNRMLASTLNSALILAFELVDADSRKLDPRVIDFLHLMARGLLQLPRDPQASEEFEVGATERARVLIAGAHTSPRTSPTTIADALGIPLRTLQRAFAAEGSSLARELRTARARTAHALLTSGSAVAGGATAIARDSGFGSTVSMRRALSELHAETGPTDPPPPAG